MNPLNYHHLHYFWAVVEYEGLARASEHLQITPQTISAQIKTLEKSTGKTLFDRQHRNLRLTEVGQKVYDYACSIFAIGEELQDFLRDGRDTEAGELVVGIANALPKFVAYHLLEPALKLQPRPRLVCREDKAERLLAELALHNFDVVLADVPVPPNISVRAYNHLLGKSDVLLMAVESLVERYQEGFPESLDNAPFLLPTRDTALRKSLDRWFHRHRIRPQIISEYEDSALLKAFGEAGVGIYPIPAVVLEDVKTHYKSRRLGILKGVEEKFYAITIEKKVQHPAVSTICSEARDVFFA